MSNDPTDVQRRTVLQMLAGLAAAGPMAMNAALAAGVLSPPPSWGSFVNGVGLWDSDDKDGEQPIIVRGAWDQITPTSCRWYQAMSRDGGKSWQESWVMQWTRA